MVGRIAKEKVTVKQVAVPVNTKILASLAKVYANRKMYSGGFNLLMDDDRKNASMLLSFIYEQIK